MNFKNNKNKEVTLLNAERAKNLYNIFMADFREEVEENNCILLNKIQPKIGEMLEREGFDSAKKALFLAAPDYFICGFMKNTKKDDSKKQVDYPAICVVGYDMPDNFVPENKNEIISDYSLIPALLRNNYKYNAITVNEATLFLRKHHIRFDDIHTLISSLDTDMGFELSYSGVDGKKKEEEYLILRKSLEIPQEVYDKIVFIAKVYYADTEEISNAAFNSTLIKMGINYRDYKYMDITAFLKQFTDIFEIKATQGEFSKNYNITIKILHNNLKNHKISEAFRTDLPPHVLPFEFDSYRTNLFDLYKKGQYNELKTTACISHAIKNLYDYELWNILINAYLKGSDYFEIEEYTFSKWEEAVFNFDAEKIEKLLSDDDFLIKEKLLDIKEELLKRLEESPKPVTTMNTLGVRMQEFLPKNSVLPAIIFGMGIEIAKSDNRRACFKSLSIEYVEKGMSDKLYKLWSEYMMYCTEVCASNVFAYCLENGKTELIPKLFSFLSEENKQSSNVYMYYTISKVLTEDFSTKLCEETIECIGKLPEDKRAEAVSIIFSNFLKADRIKDICLFSNTLILNMNKAFVHPLISKAYEIYIQNKKIISEYLLKNADADNLDLCAYAELVFKNGQENDIWNEKRTVIIERLKALIPKNENDEHSLALSKKMLLTFSNDTFFLDTYLSKLDTFYTEQSVTNRYKEIVLHLFEEGIFNGITLLYEKGVLYEFESYYWFNEILIKAFRAKMDYTNAILYQIKNLDLITNNSEDYYNCCNILAHDLYEIFFVLDFDFSRLISDDKIIEKMLEYCVNVLTRTELVAYPKACVIAFLFVIAKKYSSAAFIYSMVKNSFCDTDTYTKALEKIISAIGEMAAYDNNINDIYKNADKIEDIFEYCLTTLRYDDFMKVLKISRFFVQLEDFVKEESEYRIPQEKITGKLNLYKMVMYLCNSSDAWITLSRKASFKSEGFFAVHLLLVTHFNVEEFSLDHCTRHLNYRTANTLPKNLLENILLLLKKQKKSQDFWNAFENFVKKNNSFRNCDRKLIPQYFAELRKYPATKTLITQIFIQSGDIDSFLSVYTNDDGELDSNKILKANLNELLNALINFLCKTDEECILKNALSIPNLIEILKTFNLSKNDRTVLLWIDELYEKRISYESDTKFFEATNILIGYYPECPRKLPFLAKWDNPEDVKKVTERFKNHLNLLNRWIELFPSYYNARGLNDFYLHLPLSEIEEERQTVFRYIANASAVMYDDTREKADLLRDCKNLLAVYCLTNCNNETDIYPKLNDFIKNELKKLKGTKKQTLLLKFAKALDSIWNQNISHNIRDKIIYASIKYYWDDVIYDFLNKKIDISYLENANLKGFMEGIDARFFHRRLLQMYIYAKIVAYNSIPNDEAEKIPETYRNYYDELSRVTEFNSENTQYYELLIRIAKTSENSIKEIAQYIDSLKRDSLRSFLITASDMIEERTIQKTMTALLESLPSPHISVLIKLLFSVQDAAEIIEKTEVLIKQKSVNFKEALKILIEAEELEAFLGKGWTCYLKALHLYINNCPDDALSLVLPEYFENSPSELKSKVESLKSAIINNTPLLETSNSDFPRLSFMQNEYSTEDFNELLIQFYSNNPTYLDKDYISFARQIFYHLMHSDEEMNSYFDYVMKWGLLEEANSLNINTKIHILNELLDYASKSSEYLSYEETFYERLTYILNLVKFSSFPEYFSEFHILADKICDIYNNNPNSAGIKQIFDSLSELYKLDKMPQSEISSKIGTLFEEAKALKTSFINNKLIDKGIELISEYKNQFEQKGRLEISILNVDNLSDGSVFYTIKNAGKCAVDKISITSYICEDDSETGILIKTHYYDNKLYPKQTLPFEDTLEDFFTHFPEGESFRIKILTNYSCGDENGTPVEKEKKLYSKKESYIYRYCPSGIPSNREEFNDIYQWVCANNFVLLYGTNGTGKTSIMRMLKERFDEEKKESNSPVFSVSIECNADNNTTHDIVDMILKQICYCKETAQSGLTIYRQLEKYLNKKVKKGELAEIDYNELMEDYRETVSYEALLGRDLTILTLRDVLKNIEELFKDFEDRLKLSICILWDAFETVISSKKFTQKEHFKDLIDSFVKSSIQERKIIHIVFAGSNKLLEVVKVNSADSHGWNYLFRDILYASKKIGNLSREDFETITNNPVNLNHGDIQFTLAALDYIYDYTRGHAHYSHIFAIETLKSLDSKHRRWIYPSDINISDVTTGKDLTDQIFHDIESDSSVISVGKILAETVISERRDIYRSEIITKVISMRNLEESEIKRALEILHARDFIYETVKNDMDTAYRFTSDIYITNFLNRSIKEDKTPDAKIADESFDSDEAMLELLKLDSTMWYHLLRKHADANKLSSLKQSLISAFRDSNVPLEESSTTYNVAGDLNQQTINIQNIRIENISNSVLSLMDLASKGASMLTDSGEIEKCLSEFPKLQLKAPTTDEPYICDDELSAFNTESYSEDLENGVKQALLKSDASQEKTLDEWANAKREKLEEDGIDIEYILTLPPQTRDGILTALYLDELFETLFDISKDASCDAVIDYAPVTVMLCKALERMLKIYHLPLYQDKNVWLNEVNTFNRVSRTQGALIKFTHATLGTFTTALTSMFDIEYGSDPQSDEKNENMQSFLSSTNATEESWRKFMGDLLRLKDIRNKTAHIEPVSKEECKKTIRIMFKNEILKKSVDYIKK